MNDANRLQPDLAALARPLSDRILQSIPEVLAVYGYGSHVRGGVHPASDLDLALLQPRDAGVDPKEFLALRADLERIAGCPVELSALDRARQVVHCKEVVAHGVPIYVRDRAALDKFEMLALADYARLCDERRLVVEAYRKVRRG